MILTTVGELRKIVLEVQLPRGVQAVKPGKAYVFRRRSGAFMMMANPEEEIYKVNKSGKRFSPFGIARAETDVKWQRRWKHIPADMVVKIVDGPMQMKGDPNDYHHAFRTNVWMFEVRVGKPVGDVMHDYDGVSLVTSKIDWSDEVLYMDVRDVQFLDVKAVPNERVEKLPLVIGRTATGELRYQDVECIIKASGEVAGTKDGDTVWAFDPETLETDYIPDYFEVLHKVAPIASLTSIESGEI